MEINDRKALYNALYRIFLNKRRTYTHHIYIYISKYIDIYIYLCVCVCVCVYSVCAQIIYKMYILQILQSPSH